MADTQTTSFVLTKPEVGASRDVWGPKLNTNFDRIDDAMLGFYTAGGTGNAITITTGMSLTSVPTGMKIRFRVGSANTGATTINVDGIGAQTAVTVTGVALPNGYTRTGVDTVATWDGSNWTVDRQPERGGTIGTGGIYTKLADGSLFQIKTGSVPNTNTAIGSSFRSAAQTWTFSVPFVSASQYIVTGAGDLGASFISYGGAISASAYDFFVISPITFASTVNYVARAEGFWY